MLPWFGSIFYCNEKRENGLLIKPERFASNYFEILTSLTNGFIQKRAASYGNIERTDCAEHW